MIHPASKVQLPMSINSPQHNKRPLIKKLTFLDKCIIEPTVSEPEEVISLIFVKPKKEPGTFRVIFPLKSPNEAITCRKYKMDIVESAIKMMEKMVLHVIYRFMRCLLFSPHHTGV